MLKKKRGYIKQYPINATNIKKVMAATNKLSGKQIPSGLYKRGTNRPLHQLNVDIREEALAPGRRISKHGNVYYEYRENRTDLSSGKKQGSRL